MFKGFFEKMLNFSRKPLMFWSFRLDEFLIAFTSFSRTNALPLSASLHTNSEYKV